MTSIQNQLEILNEIDKDEYFYALKKRIYQSARAGFPLNLALYMNKIESPEVRNIIVNQVIMIIDCATRVYILLLRLNRNGKVFVFGEKDAQIREKLIWQ